MSDAAGPPTSPIAPEQDAGFLERLLDSLPSGLLLIRGDRSIGYANKAFVALWRVPSDLQIYRNDFALLNYVTSQLIDPYSFISEVERLYASQETSEDELHFKDGRIFARQSLPVIDDQGGNGRLWIYTAMDDATSLARRRMGAPAEGPGASSTASSAAHNRKGLFDVVRDVMKGQPPRHNS
ncbi:MAG: hypothetical protein QM647_14185 [Asticcacaulis sp.]|uniref:PAS domain-containing protein n=1 Tax=Asticcacaulis sp. TaxID=1872648 RepID=UPI0039E45B03